MFFVMCCFYLDEKLLSSKRRSTSHTAFSENGIGFASKSLVLYRLTYG